MKRQVKHSVCLQKYAMQNRNNTKLSYQFHLHSERVVIFVRRLFLLRSKYV